ncbi:MAG: D-alanine--D-alanine ligase [Phycisphaerales bacterium]|nr:MAG: D-alanine--D-alanine ligase [Phycisphaerales bacterium]
MPLRVLVLSGGPDAEREVSLRGGAAVAQALRDANEFEVREETLAPEFAQRPLDDMAGALRAIPADVVWPLLHGPFGEGGPLQDVLERDGRPYVGSRPRAARRAMDKMATKLVAARLGIATGEACAFNPRDHACPLALPVVLKPVFEGSTIGLHVCKDEGAWRHAREESSGAGRPCMVESFLPGREITVGLLQREGAWSALPIIEIAAQDGLYDYEAKYVRNDTRYIVDPPLPPGAADAARDASLRLAQALGVRHVARADFIVPEAGGPPSLLEINTMPGFTDHSLVPMAARAAGLEMSVLCAAIVRAALGRNA